MAIEFNVDQALAKLGELVAKHGPEAVNVAAQVVQVNAVGNLVEALVTAVFAVVAGVATAKMIKLASRKIRDDSYTHINVFEDQFGWQITSGLGAIGTAVLAAIAASGLFSVWNWTAIFYPKLALAHEILNKLTGGN